MFNVYQHWDPLKVCVVGRSYPPEFYSWITVPHVRNLFEKIAQETEEDYQNIIKKLESFGVTVLRPELPKDLSQLKSPGGKWQKPPMNPRDLSVMIGKEFYFQKQTFKDCYDNIKGPNWPACDSWKQFYQLPDHIQQECIDVHNINASEPGYYSYEFYKNIIEYLEQHNTTINYLPENNDSLCGATISRIGKDLYFGTNNYSQDINSYKSYLDKQFPNYRNHVVNTGGHSDATYCPVCPGLIISLHDVPSYANTYPDWEVVYLPGQSWTAIKSFLELKSRNRGRWWIPGFEQDQDVIDTVESWLNHWTGYVEETVFDVNMLIIDPKNVIVFNYNKLVFDALERYGITPHIVPFRHRYFWDGGIHCVTTDLHREGTMQNYFPQRG